MRTIGLWPMDTPHKSPLLMPSYQKQTEFHLIVGQQRPVSIVHTAHTYKMNRAMWPFSVYSALMIHSAIVTECGQLCCEDFLLSFTMRLSDQKVKDALTHPCPNFNGCSVMLGHGWALHHQKAFGYGNTFMPSYQLIQVRRNGFC